MDVCLVVAVPVEVALEFELLVLSDVVALLRVGVALCCVVVELLVAEVEVFALDCLTVLLAGVPAERLTAEVEAADLS